MTETKYVKCKCCNCGAPIELWESCNIIWGDDPGVYCNRLECQDAFLEKVNEDND